MNVGARETDRLYRQSYSVAACSHGVDVAGQRWRGFRARRWASTLHGPAENSDGGTASHVRRPRPRGSLQP
jgi:hypothetical protein